MKKIILLITAALLLVLTGCLSQQEKSEVSKEEKVITAFKKMAETNGEKRGNVSNGTRAGAYFVYSGETYYYSFEDVFFLSGVKKQFFLDLYTYAEVGSYIINDEKAIDIATARTVIEADEDLAAKLNADGVNAADPGFAIQPNDKVMVGKTVDPTTGAGTAEEADSDPWVGPITITVTEKTPANADITLNNITVYFVATAGEKLGYTFTVKNPAGTTVAVNPVDIALGQTSAVVTFTAPIADVAVGTWTVDDKDYVVLPTLDIASIAPIADTDLTFGIAKEKVISDNLPATVAAKLNDGTDVTLNVAWTCATYNGYEHGEYVFTGTVSHASAGTTFLIAANTITAKVFVSWSEGIVEQIYDGGTKIRLNEDGESKMIDIAAVPALRTYLARMTATTHQIIGSTIKFKLEPTGITDISEIVLEAKTYTHNAFADMTDTNAGVARDSTFYGLRITGKDGTKVSGNVLDISMNELIIDNVDFEVYDLTVEGNTVQFRNSSVKAEEFTIAATAWDFKAVAGTENAVPYTGLDFINETKVDEGVDVTILARDTDIEVVGKVEGTLTVGADTRDVNITVAEIDNPAVPTKNAGLAIDTKATALDVTIVVTGAIKGMVNIEGVRNTLTAASIEGVVETEDTAVDAVITVAGEIKGNVKIGTAGAPVAVINNKITANKITGNVEVNSSTTNLTVTEKVVGNVILNAGTGFNLPLIEGNLEINATVTIPTNLNVTGNIVINGADIVVNNLTANNATLQFGINANGVTITNSSFKGLAGDNHAAAKKITFDTVTFTEMRNKFNAADANLANGTAYDFNNEELSFKNMTWPLNQTGWVNNVTVSGAKCTFDTMNFKGTVAVTGSNATFIAPTVEGTFTVDAATDYLTVTGGTIKGAVTVTANSDNNVFTAVTFKDNVTANAGSGKVGAAGADITGAFDTKFLGKSVFEKNLTLNGTKTTVDGQTDGFTVNGVLTLTLKSTLMNGTVTGAAASVAALDQPDTYFENVVFAYTGAAGALAVNREMTFKGCTFTKIALTVNDNDADTADKSVKFENAIFNGESTFTAAATNKETLDIIGSTFEGDVTMNLQGANPSTINMNNTIIKFDTVKNLGLTVDSANMNLSVVGGEIYRPMVFTNVKTAIFEQQTKIYNNITTANNSDVRLVQSIVDAKDRAITFTHNSAVQFLINTVTFQGSNGTSVTGAGKIVKLTGTVDGKAAVTINTGAVDIEFDKDSVISNIAINGDVDATGTDVINNNVSLQGINVTGNFVTKNDINKLVITKSSTRNSLIGGNLTLTGGNKTLTDSTVTGNMTVDTATTPIITDVTVAGNLAVANDGTTTLTRVNVTGTSALANKVAANDSFNLVWDGGTATAAVTIDPDFATAGKGSVAFTNVNMKANMVTNNTLATNPIKTVTLTGGTYEGTTVTYAVAPADAIAFNNVTFDGTGAGVIVADFGAVYTGSTFKRGLNLTVGSKLTNCEVTGNLTVAHADAELINTKLTNALTVTLTIAKSVAFTSGNIKTALTLGAGMKAATIAPATATLAISGVTLEQAANTVDYKATFGANTVFNGTVTLTSGASTFTNTTFKNDLAINDVNAEFKNLKFDATANAVAVAVNQTSTFDGAEYVANTANADKTTLTMANNKTIVLKGTQKWTAGATAANDTLAINIAAVGASYDDLLATWDPRRPVVTLP